MDTSTDTSFKQAQVDKLVVDKVTTLYKDYDSVLKSYRDDLNKWLKMYRCIPPDNKNYDGEANVFVPEFHRAIETDATNMFQVCTAEDPFFVVEGREEQDIKNAKVIEALLEYQLQEAGLKRKLLPMFRNFLINGLVVVKICWKYDTKTVYIAKKDEAGNTIYDDTGEMVIDEEQKIICDRPDIELVNLLDFYIDPTATCIDEADWIMERKRVPYNQLKAWSKIGYIKNIDTIKVKKANKNNADTDNREQRFSDIGINLKSASKADYDIYEYWGKAPKSFVKPELQDTDDGKELIETHLIVCDGVCLRTVPNPYFHQKKPYLACSWTDINEMFFGVGLGQICERPQQELNDTHNQTIDFKSFSVKNMWLKRKGCGIKNKDLKIKVNGIIEGDSITENDIRPVTPNSSGFIQADKIEQTIREDIRNVTAAISTLQGIPLKGNQTLGEIQLLSGEGAGRIKALTTFFSEMIIKPMLTMFYQLDLQYLDQDVMVKIIGEQGYEYMPVNMDSIVGNYDFIPKSMADITNRTTIRKNLIDYMHELIGLVPLMPELKQSIYKLARKIYENLGFKDINDVLPVDLVAQMPMQPMGMGGVPAAGQEVLPQEIPPQI